MCLEVDKINYLNYFHMPILIIVVIVLVAWLVRSYLSSKAERIDYQVLEKSENYEIRKYRPFIAMQVEVDEVGDRALNEGFKILARYIFGANVSKASLAMTAPVLVEGKSEKIAMTAPVLQSSLAGKTTVTFTAPRNYSIETLPIPLDSRIRFRTISSKIFAVYRFTWYYNARRIAKKKQHFLEMLKRDEVEILGEPIFAAYNGPGTMPFLMRNEILVEVAWD